MSSYKSREESFLTKLKVGFGSLALYMVGSFLLHQFTTSSQDITQATVIDKKLDWHMRKTGKYSSTKEWDHFIKTDKGMLRDETSEWDDKNTEGICFDSLKVGETYDFKVVHDHLTQENNIIKAKVYNGPQY